MNPRLKKVLELYLSLSAKIKYMLKNNYKKYWVFVIGGLIFFLTLLIYLVHLLLPEKLFSWSFLLSTLFPIIAFATYLDYYVVVAINKSKWVNSMIILRVSVELAIISTLAAFYVLIGHIPYLFGNNIEVYFTTVAFGESLIAAVLLNIFTVIVLEFFVQLRHHQKLKEEYAKMLYKQLKDQINPHFLFNSLNVLVSLINKDAQRATDYTKKLSDVYRYVLTNDTEDTVSVKKELEFIRNYIEILQIRFGDGLQVHLSINEEILNKRIPAMALQVLVENAVKHNALSVNQPLMIDIGDDGSYLVVANNIIPRFRIEKSTNIGLKNLNNKYMIISNKSIVIANSQDEFIVKIPLL